MQSTVSFDFCYKAQRIWANPGRFFKEIYSVFVNLKPSNPDECAVKMSYNSTETTKLSGFT